MTMRKTLALNWLARQDALGYKGKRADDMCLEYWLGALAALEACGHPETGNIRNITGFLIATRGAAFCKELAAPKEDEPAPNEDRLGFGIERETED